MAVRQVSESSSIMSNPGLTEEDEKEKELQFIGGSFQEKINKLHDEQGPIGVIDYCNLMLDHGKPLSVDDHYFLLMTRVKNLLHKLSEETIKQANKDLLTAQTIAKNPEQNTEIFRYLARVAIANKDFKTARVHYQDALKSSYETKKQSHQTKIAAEYIKMLHDLGENQDAAKICSEILASFPGDLNILRLHCKILKVLEKWKSAIECCNEVRLSKAKNIYKLELMGLAIECCRKINDLTQEKLFLKTANEFDTDFENSLARSKRLLEIELLQSPEAILSKNSDQFCSHFDLVETANSILAYPEEAYQFLAPLKDLELPPLLSSMILLRFALACGNLPSPEHLQEAKNSLERVLKISHEIPKNIRISTIYQLLARISIRMKKYDDAIQWIEKGELVDEANSPFYRHVIIDFDDNFNVDEALKFADHIFKMGKKWTGLFYFLAKIYTYSKKWKETRIACHDYVKVDQPKIHRLEIYDLSKQAALELGDDVGAYGDALEAFFLDESPELVERYEELTKLSKSIDEISEPFSQSKAFSHILSAGENQLNDDEPQKALILFLFVLGHYENLSAEEQCRVIVGHAQACLAIKDSSQYSNIEANLQKALKLPWTEKYEIYRSLALLCIETKKIYQASEYFKKGMELTGYNQRLIERYRYAYSEFMGKYIPSSWQDFDERQRLLSSNIATAFYKLGIGNIRDASVFLRRAKWDFLNLPAILKFIQAAKSTRNTDILDLICENFKSKRLILFIKDLLEAHQNKIIHNYLNELVQSANKSSQLSFLLETFKDEFLQCPDDHITALEKRAKENTAKGELDLSQAIVDYELILKLDSEQAKKNQRILTDKKRDEIDKFLAKAKKEFSKSLKAAIATHKKKAEEAKKGKKDSIAIEEYHEMQELMRKYPSYFTDKERENMQKVLQEPVEKKE